MTPTPAPDVDDLHAFLLDAATDAAARAGDPFGDRTPLTTAFAGAELDLITRLRALITDDEQARAFVRLWRTLVQTTDDYPQRRGAMFASTDDATWTIGAQKLRATCTLFDAFVRDELVTGYRVLGTVVEDVEDAAAKPSSPHSAKATP